MILQDFSTKVVEGGDLCDLGYELRDLSVDIYCNWVCDCAEHVMPICTDHIPSEDLKALRRGLAVARDFAGGRLELPAYTSIIKEIDAVESRAHSSGALTNWHVSEAFSAICYAIKQADQNSGICHEDIIYAASRAAYEGADGDLSEELESSDCCDDSKLEGCEQSRSEEAWQLAAMRRRLENKA